MSSKNSNPISDLADAFDRQAVREKEERIALFNKFPRTKKAVEEIFGVSDAAVMFKHQPPIVILNQAAMALFMEGPDAAAGINASIIRHQLKSIYAGYGWSEPPV